MSGSAEALYLVAVIGCLALSLRAFLGTTRLTGINFKRSLGLAAIWVLIIGGLALFIPWFQR